jgi:hypothetical protein
MRGLRPVNAAWKVPTILTASHACAQQRSSAGLTTPGLAKLLRDILGHWHGAAVWSKANDECVHIRHA